MNNYDDKINPEYYKKFGLYQPIEIIEHYNLPHHLATALAYILRYGHKTPPDDLTDIYKAIWYLNRFIFYKQSRDNKYE